MAFAPQMHPFYFALTNCINLLAVLRSRDIDRDIKVRVTFTLPPLPESAKHCFLFTRWTVLKRLSQFASLNEFMATNFPTYTITVPFPALTIGDSCRSLESKGTLKEAKLDAWLQQLISFPDLMWCWEVRNFFAVPSAQVRPVLFYQHVQYSLPFLLQVLAKGTKNKDASRCEGYLYVKIVAATELPTRPDGTAPNVFCKACIVNPLSLAKNDIPTTQLTTQMVRHSINPIVRLPNLCVLPHCAHFFLSVQ